MLDLHCHLLPGVDDGSLDIGMSVEMARIAAADGIRIIACTPHVFPPRYMNNRESIKQGVAELSRRLKSEFVDLQLVVGGDVHMLPSVDVAMRDGCLPTLNGSKYFLLEPSHTVCPPNFLATVKGYLSSGFVPVITHPERFRWIDNCYSLVCQAEEAGAAVQVTAGAIEGRFGSTAKSWALRLLLEGRVDVIASDAHDCKHRPPIMSKARDIVAELISPTVARALVFDNPLLILRNQPLPAKKRSVLKGDSFITSIGKLLRFQGQSGSS